MYSESTCIYMYIINMPYKYYIYIHVYTHRTSTLYVHVYTHRTWPPIVDFPASNEEKTNVLTINMYIRRIYMYLQYTHCIWWGSNLKEVTQWLRLYKLTDVSNEHYINVLFCTFILGGRGLIVLVPLGCPTLPSWHSRRASVRQTRGRLLSL